MSVNLVKGQKISLVKEGGGLKKVMVGLGWDEAAKPSGFLSSLFGAKPADIDCDASVLLLNAAGKLAGDVRNAVIYYGNLRHVSGAVIHQGDNLTGSGEGDDEEIMVDLERMPADIARLVFTVNIYDANVRSQHFGMIRNAFIRIVDSASRRELCRYNLSENYEGMTGLIVGEIYRHGGEWKFSAVGQPVQNASRLDSIINMYR